MDRDDFGLPPLEEILGKSEKNDGNKNVESGEIRSPWYSEVCPTAKGYFGMSGEIKVTQGPHGNKVACGHLNGEDCRIREVGGDFLTKYKRCDFL